MPGDARSSIVSVVPSAHHLERWSGVEFGMQCTYVHYESKECIWRMYLVNVIWDLEQAEREYIRPILGSILYPIISGGSPNI